jgi:hypothetical protein
MVALQLVPLKLVLNVVVVVLMDQMYVKSCVEMVKITIIGLVMMVILQVEMVALLIAK